MTAFAAFLLLAAVFGGALALTGTVRRVLVRRAVLDIPNERSSHARPVPRGGGIAIVAMVLPAWLAVVAAGAVPASVAIVAAGAAALAALSFLDDLSSRPAALRFAVQIAAVAAGIAALPPDGPVFQGWLPPALDRAAAVFLWLWFVNLYNFMDGIDGIAGTETACLGAGIALVAAVAAAPPALAAGPAAVLALACAAAALGFLRWNWHPATIFMGDVGSVPLGYLLGFLLLGLAAQGLWQPALILPLYYLADATWTLLRRLLRGEKIWQAHREHFYQRAVQKGLRHDAVVRRILAANLVLVALALWSAWSGGGASVLPLLAAAATVAILLAELSRKRRPASIAGSGRAA
jgi:UDP-N-acetylmuramyl pentapeptide phosphotransferase/UDP-N-acetylglucosamine-1-phosphate transferase